MAVIDMSDRMLFEQPSVQIDTSPELAAPVWTVQSFLFLSSLRTAAAPDIDRAELYFEYGNVTQIGALVSGLPYTLWDPLALNGQFVRITISSVDGIVDPIVWHGVIECDTRAPRGEPSGVAPPAGRQELTCFGLLRLLERVFFRSSVKEDGLDDGGEFTISQGLPFNVDPSGAYAQTGNRSVTQTDGGTYVFSDAPNEFDGDAAEWTAYDAVQYLLAHHVPLDSDGDLVANWRVIGNSANLSWYKIKLHTDGHSVKELLDALIPRKRAVGYWCDYDPGSNTISIETYTLMTADLILPDSSIIAANPLKYSLDFDESVDVSHCVMRSVATSRYHQVVAQGEFKTTTLTLGFNGVPSPQFVRGWTDADQAAYLAAGSALLGYGVLAPAEQSRLNAIARTSAQVSHVFARYGISAAWDQTTVDLDAPTDLFFAAPSVNPDGSINPILIPGVVDTGEPLWNLGLRIEPLLTLKDRGWDYSGTNIATGTFNLPNVGQGRAQFARPFFFVNTGSDDTGSYWEKTSQLSATAAFESHNRHWDAPPTIFPQGPLVDLRVSGGPQQFLAAADWVGAATTDPEHDPAKNAGLDWRTLRATVTIRMNNRASATAVISTPAPGAPLFTYYLNVPNARIDYVVPSTVVRLDSGQLVKSTSGGYVANDWQRLVAIAQAAAAWYGVERRTLDLTFSQVRDFVVLGSIITDVHNFAPYTAINTVVTSISYSWPEGYRAIPSTSIETSFPEFDLQ